MDVLIGASVTDVQNVRGCFNAEQCRCVGICEGRGCGVVLTFILCFGC
jgi:hypothetical protein